MKNTLIFLVLVALALGAGGALYWIGKSALKRHPPASAKVPSASVAQAPAGVAAAAPAPAVEEVPAREPVWVLRNEYALSAGGKLPEWYTSNANWAAGSELDLLGSEDRALYFALSERVPHRVKWELQFKVGFVGGWQNKVIEATERGVCVGIKNPTQPQTLDPQQDHTLTIERAGRQLKVQVDERELPTLAVWPDDRTSLRAWSENYELILVRSRVYLDEQAQLCDPPAAVPPAETKTPVWRTAYQDNFEDPESPKKYYVIGDVRWQDKYKALALRAPGGDKDAYAVIHQALPGDVRIRFKALRLKTANQVSVGLYVGVRGALKRMDGYFIEWGRGLVQVKKRNHLERRVNAPTPQTADRWVDLEFRRVGSVFTMSMQNQVVLQWVDLYPLLDEDHDLASLYVCADQVLVKDLIIERNANDTLTPHTDDPATEENALRSVRRGVSAPAANDF